MSGLAADPLDPALVRLREGGRILGAGFLIAPEVVATCAHVIDGVRAPVADFPFLRSAGHAVEVLERDDGLDIAILRLPDPPPGALPVPARITGGVRDHRFRTFGFPADLPDGVWVTGRLVGAQGAGRIQMAQDPGHLHIEPGFSGAPVWDEDLSGVVGMVVTAGRGETTAHLVPTTALGDAWTIPARNPYRGLRPFREDDAELFHGREPDIDRLLQLVERQEIVAIAGPSGSGKSSLVRAGLLPRLRRSGATIVDLGPEDEIPTAPGTVLVLDQFEETVVENPAVAREKLAEISRLVAAGSRKSGEPAPLRAVLTLRSRSLDDLITKDTAEELNRAVWFLEPMSREQLAAAIERPAAAVGGLAFESGLVQRILDDAADEAGTLPLVSLVLEQLWQHRRGGWLTHQAYEELGRVPGALSKAADDVLRSRSPRKRDDARKLLTRLTRPDGEGGHARRSAQLDDLSPELREIAHDLATKRLVVIQEQRVNLTHQALIDHWPQLRDWLTEDADFLTWLVKLQDLQHSGGQLTGAPLARAADWTDRRRDDIPAAQRDFISRSEAANRRSQRRWRTITAISATLTVIAVVLAGTVATYAVRTSDQLHSTNAAQLAQMSDRAAETDPRQSLQLALAAYREKPESSEAYAALFKQRLYWHGVKQVIPPTLLPDFRSMQSSADGRVQVIYPGDTSKPPSVWWDLRGPNPRHRVLPVDQEVSPPDFVQLSPDGRFLAVSAKQSMGLRVLDLANLDRWIELVPDQEQVRYTGFSANSRFLTTKHTDDRGMVRVWDLTTGHELPSRVTYEDAPDPVSQLFPSPDGKYLIVREMHRLSEEAYENSVVVRELATGARLRTYSIPESLASYDIKLARGGTLLVSCDDEGVRAVETLTGRTHGTLLDRPCKGLWIDKTGSYVLSPDTGSGGAQHIIDLARWQREFNTGDLVSLTDSLLSPLGDHARTSIGERDGAVVVRTVTTSSESLDGYESFTPAPDGSRWAAFRAAPDDGEDSPLPEGPEDDEIAMLDASGAVLATTTLATSPEYVGPPEFEFDATGSRIAVGLGPRLYVYRTADMVLERELPLPMPPGHDLSELSEWTSISLLRGGGGELLVSAGGMLSSWDITTGAQTGPPIIIEAPEPQGELPDSATLTARPGHPEQVLLTSDEKVAVWDLRLRKSLRDFPFHPTNRNRATDAPVLSPDGKLAAVREFQGTRVLDLDALEVVSEINTHGASIYGISGDFLFTGEGVWDWRQRRALSSKLDLSNAALEEEGFLLDRRPGQRELISMNPEVWFDDLCRLSDRDFTDQELQLLPEGAGQDRPCG
ncbi:trypsin-like peptidase domain-containing protein [Saccharopolyspora shandongensis]|uniref:nSTAND1 domain-containing NTPase n=1 Tax=Saccharopolyspora shandongensis TaxID=418495 RepID=UPI00341673AE